jgi:hypothetical protein
MLLMLLAELSFGGKVLVTSATDSNIISKITAHGHTVTTLSLSSWASQSKSYFQGFDALYIGDHYPDSSTAAALKASSGFGPAIDGRIVLTGLHAEGHGKYDFPANAVDWVADGTGTGIVVLADWSNRNYDWLNQGSFTVSSYDSDTYTHSGHPAYGGLSASYFFSWGNSIHYRFTAWPSDFSSIGTASGNHITIARGEKCKDGDGDGYRDKTCGGDDCDDSRAGVNPGAAELCATTYDDDCDGSINETSAIDASTWYRDADGDKYGSPSVTTKACTLPSGYLSDRSDCDDADSLTYPGATETVGDLKDQSCDGKEVCFQNIDGDGYRTSLTVDSSDLDCSDPGEAARTVSATDCDDGDAKTFPGATEVVADEKDQSCDGAEICYQDNDNDKWRTGLTRSSSDVDCADSGEARASTPATDCDDSDALTYPGATESIADGKDQSCDGREICYVDGDLDRYRTSATVTSTDADCADSGEALASMSSGDCDDSDRFTYPGAAEVVGDEKDQSCDGGELCWSDFDNDGWRIDTSVASADADCADSGEARTGEPSGDCDDRDSASYPGAAEVAYDGVDQNCDGDDLCDVDLDGFDADKGSCPGTDCDDDDPDINPRAIERWYDGLDGDCDGSSDYDADRDGFDASDYGGDDCDDADGDIFPEAEEIWYDGIDQDCDEGSDFDADGDGFDGTKFGGEDCADDDASVYPGAPELADGIDNDCNGVDEDDDTDGDGLADEVELTLDLDPLDPDTDGDGVYDGIEVGDDQKPLDTDGDKTIDALDTDDDGDGLDTERENLGTEDGSPLKDYPDTDRDGTPDFRDTDSDGDGYDDEVETDVDTDRDGMPDYLDEDSDQDGILDADEVDQDRDNDGAADRVDVDDDGDKLPSLDEGVVDTDGDGEPDYLDLNSDDDNRDDAEELANDDDCDGVVNAVDANDVDGPCAGLGGLSSSFQSAACGGADATSAPSAWWLLALGLLGLGRRR